MTGLLLSITFLPPAFFCSRLLLGGWGGVSAPGGRRTPAALQKYVKTHVSESAATKRTTYTDLIKTRLVHLNLFVYANLSTV